MNDSKWNNLQHFRVTGLQNIWKWGMSENARRGVNFIATHSKRRGLCKYIIKINKCNLQRQIKKINNS